MPPLSGIAHRISIPDEEKTVAPISVAEYRKLNALDFSRGADTDTDTGTDTDTIADKDADTAAVSSTDEHQKWFDVLTPDERLNVIGDRRTLRAGSPNARLSEPSVTARVDVERLPISKIERLSANVDHNMQSIRAYYTNTDVVFGLPVTARLSYVSSSDRSTAVPTTDYLRYLWTAYSGALPRRDAEPLWNSEGADRHTIRSPYSSTDDNIDVGHDDNNGNTHSTSDTSDETDGVAVVSAIPNGVVEKNISPSKPIRRPNGQLYYPRRLVSGGLRSEVLYDVEMLRRARKSNMHVLLYGEPGTGKTALVEAAFDGVLTANGHGDFEVSDFFGSFIETADRQFVWLDGQLLKAAKLGLPFFVDDASLIDPRVLSVLYPAMDGRREINVTTNPEVGMIRTHPDFYIIAACNPNAPGSVMSEALLSRFSIHLEVTTDFELMKRLGVPENVVIASENLATQAKTGAVLRAPQARDLLDFMRVHNEFGSKIAVSNLLARAEHSDKELYRKALQATFGTNIVSLAV